jgi:hypothetical protein
MKNKIIPLLFLVIIFNACSPVTPQHEILNGAPATPDPATAKINTPSFINTPTPEPITLPVDRFHSLPVLSPITLVSSKDVQEVASFADSQLSALVTKDQSKLVVRFESGVQIYDLPDLFPHSFLELKLSAFSATNATSEDGKYVARTYPGADHPFKQVVSIWDTEIQKEVCNIKMDERRGNYFYLSFHPEQNTFSVHGDFLLEAPNNVMVWSLSTCQKIFDEESDSPISSVSEDGKYVAATNQGQVVVFDVNKKTKTPIGDKTDVLGVGILSNSGKVIISYRTRTIIYDIDSGEETGRFDANLDGYYSNISIINNGEWIIVKGFDKNYFWNSAENIVYAVRQNLGADFTFNQGVVQTYQSIFSIRTGGKIDLTKYGDQPDIALSAWQIT